MNTVWFYLVLVYVQHGGMAIVPAAYNEKQCTYAAEQAEKSGLKAVCIPANR